MYVDDARGDHIDEAYLRVGRTTAAFCFPILLQTIIRHGLQVDGLSPP